MCFEGLARLSRRVWRHFVRGSREISLVPSLHRASTDALIVLCIREKTIRIPSCLAQLEDTLYPSNYNSSIEERHREARASRPMRKSHDLYALSIIIENLFRHTRDGQSTYNLLRGPNPDLNTIAQTLLNKHI